MFPLPVLSVRPYFYGALVVVLIAAGVTIRWQYGTINQLKEDLYNAINANKTNQQTITKLIDEREKAVTTCEARLSAKDQLIKRLRSIDDLKPASHQVVSPTVGVVGIAVISGTDYILAALNGMLPGEGSSSDGLYSSGSPTSSAGADILPREVVGYCTDEVGARNLLKNIVLLRAWALDTAMILISMQTVTVQP